MNLESYKLVVFISFFLSFTIIIRLNSLRIPSVVHEKINEKKGIKSTLCTTTK